MLPKQAAAISVAVRILQAVATQTFFQPDEYFQSLEVAHRAVFGYGHLTWEWSVAKPIRSILFPSLWIPVYWFLKFTGLHATPALVRSRNTVPSPTDRHSDLGPESAARPLRLYHRHSSL